MYGNPSAAVQNLVGFTMSLSSPMPNALYTLLTVIQQIYFDIVSEVIDFEVYRDRSSITTTTADFILLTSSANFLKSLIIKYLIVDSNFPLCAYHYERISGSSTVIDSSTPQTYTTSFTEVVSTTPTSAVHVWVSFDGMNGVLLDSTNQFDFFIQINLLTSSDISITYSTISTKSFKYFRITCIGFVYNDNDQSSNPIPFRTTMGVFNLPSSNSVTSPLAYDFNSLWGVQSFHIANQNFYQYHSSIASNTITAGSNNTELFLQVDYFFMEFFCCVYPTPNILLPARVLCYDACPPRTSTNEVAQECSPCYYTCLSCSTTPACISCSASDNRVLSGTSCNAMPGFYDNGNPVAAACTSPCLTCSGSAITCQTCVSNYYKSGSTCLPCLAFCSVCLTATTCTTCNLFYSFVGGVCIGCSANCTNCTSATVCTACANTFYVSASVCDPCPTNCNLCSSSTVCTTCITAYYWTGSLCTPCATNCTVCSSPTACTACTAAYYPLLGSCVPCVTPCSTCTTVSLCSTCVDATYLSATSCLPCPTFCATCASPSLCYTCLTSAYLINSLCKSCSTNCLTCTSTLNCITCALQYYSAFGVCVACSTNCANCTSPTLCTNCLTGFYVVGGACAACSTNCSQCTSPSVCTLCVASFYLANPTSCLPCIAICLNCTSVAVCSSCVSGYYVQSAMCTTCITPCATCNSSTFCFTCIIGYYIASSSCLLCPTNCSACTSPSLCTNCTNGTYLLTSLCTLCPTLCLNCTSASLCTKCTLGFYLSGGSCVACTANCTNCTSAVACTQCTLGFYLNIGSCVACTANCTNCTSASLCTNCTLGFYLSGSVCAPCMLLCLDCLSATTCSNCTVSYIFNGSACIDNCLDVPHCNKCTVAASLTTCLNCTLGYALASNACNAICADGIKQPQEPCDDSNLLNGDGCSSTCTVESGYLCNQTTAGGTSLCYLVTFSLTTVSVIKNTAANSAVLTFLPNVAHSAFLTLNWTNVLNIQMPNGETLVISNTTYDAVTGLLSVDVSYTSDINGAEMTVTAPTLMNQAPSLKYLSPTSVAAQEPIVTSNNLGLNFYPDQVYAMGSYAEWVATALGAAAFLLFAAGLFSGKIIGLEAAAAVQLAYFSLMTNTDLSPTAGALTYLQYSSGYNEVLPLDNYSVPREMTCLNLDRSVVGGFNLTAVFFLAPLLLALILFIASAFADEKKLKLRSMAATAFGEYTFYGLLFGTYLFLSADTIAIAFSGNITALAIGAVLLLLLIAYSVLMAYQPQMFGEFKEKFKTKGIASHTYSLIVAQKLLIITPIIFTFQMLYSNLFIGIVLILQLIFVLVKRPYLEANARPLFNISAQILIQGLYLVMKVMAGSQIALFAPLAVEGILACVLIISVIAFVRELKDKFGSKAEVEDKMPQFQQLRQFRLNSFKNQLYGNQAIDETGSPTILSNASSRKTLNLEEVKKKLLMEFRQDKRKLTAPIVHQLDFSFIGGEN